MKISSEVEAEELAAFLRQRSLQNAQALFELRAASAAIAKENDALKIEIAELKTRLAAEEPARAQTKEKVNG